MLTLDLDIASRFN